MVEDFELNELLDDDIIAGSKNQCMCPGHGSSNVVATGGVMLAVGAILGGLVAFLMPKRGSKARYEVEQDVHHNQVLWDYAMENGFTLRYGQDGRGGNMPYFPVNKRRAYSDDWALHVMDKRGQVIDMNGVRKGTWSLGPKATNEEVRMVERVLASDTYNYFGRT